MWRHCYDTTACGKPKIEPLGTAQAQCSLTNTPAIPIPEPIHILVTKILPPVCFAILRPVAICRAPAGNSVHPVSH